MGLAMQYNNIVQAQYLPCMLASPYTPPSSDLQRPSSLDLPSHSSSTPWMKLVGSEKALMWSWDVSTIEREEGMFGGEEVISYNMV
ncbi:hypothetical protein NC651_004026 [Populus alba x Populus x berolinensis]|nr:hypothetical protein NC651_004026 [Populus alba x Populus x berolinensis]